MNQELKKIFEKSERIIVKLGTQVVSEKNGDIARKRIAQISKDCAYLVKEKKKKIVIVSSGAVGLGRHLLKKLGTLSLAEKQACAAAGQPLLMNEYQKTFSKEKIHVAQILVTTHNFADRMAYLNLKKTFDQLLDMGVIPIVNENDSVSTSELKSGSRSNFGDNDRLSALVAGKFGADLLVILTDVDGLYDRNPHTDGSAKKISIVKDFTFLSKIKVRGKSTYGTGGMFSKVEAARVASICGVNTIITSGLQPGAIRRMMDTDHFDATLILAKKGMTGRKRWIGFSTNVSGTVVINSGACEAILGKHASLLPVGVVSAQGTFKKGEFVSIQDERGKEIGRGIANHSSHLLNRIKGLRNSEIHYKIKSKLTDEFIHKDNLVVFSE